MQKMNEGSKNFNLYSLVAAALITAISVAMAPLNIYIPLFGVSSLRFSFTEIPVFIGGALFGPIIGMICGFLSDVLGFIIAPAGPYFFGFTFNKMMVGLIPGLIFYRFKNLRSSTIIKINIGLLVSALLGGTFYINVMAIEDIKQLASIKGIPMNIILTLGMIISTGILPIIMYKLIKIFEGKEEINKIEVIIMAVSFKYIIVSLILSPLWVKALYNVPIVASVMARIFKGLVDVPLQVILCFAILQAIPLKIKQKITCS